VSDRRVEQNWPCCSEGQTQLFASVVGSGVPGVWRMEFDREATRRDLLWDQPFIVAENQRVSLSGQAANVARNIRPQWAPGYTVNAGGALSLAFFTTTGELLLEAGAVALNLTDSIVTSTAQFRGGVVSIVRSSVTDGVQVLFGMASLGVLNSTIFADPHFDFNVATPFITITASELRRWPQWAQIVRSSNATGILLSDITVSLHEDQGDGRKAGLVLGEVNTCEPEERCDGGFRFVCLPGFEGDDCITGEPCSP